MPFDGTGFALVEHLNKIDAIIDLLGAPERWCKGALRSRDGRYCLRGAINAIGNAAPLEPVILGAIVEVTGKNYRHIESFNDHPHTDHEQVCAVLLRARDNIVTGKSVVGARRPPVPAVQAFAEDRSRLGLWWDGVKSWFEPAT